MKRVGLATDGGRKGGVIVMVVGVICCLGRGEAVEVYVSPRGKENARGSRAEPVATVARALEIVRRSEGERRIVVRSGSYFGVSAEMGPEDSGLVLEGERGEWPVLYGGVEVRGWEREGERWVSAPVPAGSEGVEVRLLEVGGVLAQRARYPASGTLVHESEFGVRWMSSSAGGWERKPTGGELTALRYKAGDLGEWLNLRNAELTVFHMWDESSVGLAAHDAGSRTLTFSSPAGHPPGAFGVKKYIVWNVREGMAAAGQWYHDRERGRIVYWPLPGQVMGKTPVVAGTRESVLRVRGKAGAPVRGITIRGLRVSVTTVPLRAAGFASDAFAGAVALEHAEGCVLENLVVARVAGQGVAGASNCRSIRVSGCAIADCGAGGVYVGGEGAVIENNHIRGIGLSYPSAIGIYRGGKNSVVRYNEVHDTSYSGINYGGENNIVEGNLLYRCMRTLHDGAAIYMFGAKRCVLRGNVVRDIENSGGYGASAFYLDERSEECVVEGNVAIRVPWVFQNHMAQNNTIRNNVAVVEGDAKIAFARSSGYTFEGNVISATGKIRIENGKAVGKWGRNVLHSGSGVIERAVLKEGGYSQVGMEEGVPEGAVTGDPLFVDWRKGEMRYRAGSSAAALGLKPVDLRGAGRRVAEKGVNRIEDAWEWLR